MKEIPFLESTAAIIESLKKISFLKNLDGEHLEKIFRMSRLRSYEAGEVLIPEGVYDTFLYILISGEVKIVRQGAVLAWLRETGAIFGELAIIDYQPRSASVIAVNPTVCLAADSSFLDNLSPADQGILYAIIYRSLAEVLTERLRTTSGELAALKEAMTAR